MRPLVLFMFVQVLSVSYRADLCGWPCICTYKHRCMCMPTGNICSASSSSTSGSGTTGFSNCLTLFFLIILDGNLELVLT